MRIMEDPQAEQEADQLSLGIRSRTPDMLMREMGGRLGADISSVRFHSDSKQPKQKPGDGCPGLGSGA